MKVADGGAPNSAAAADSDAAAGGAGGGTELTTVGLESVSIPTAADSADAAPNGNGSAAPTTAVSADGSTPAPPTEQPRVIRYGAWLALIISVLSMSAVGPTFVYVQRMGVDPVLAASWRCQCMLVFLIVPALIEHFYVTPAATRWAFMKPKPGEWNVLWVMLLQSMCWATSLSLWVVGLQYTTTVRASLFSSTYPIWLLLWVRFGTGVRVSIGEFAGVGICFCGVVVSMYVSVCLRGFLIFSYYWLRFSD